MESRLTVETQTGEEKIIPLSSARSVEAKKEIISQLIKLDVLKIQPVLIKAALSFQEFPPPLNEAIKAMQDAYKLHQGKPTIAPHLAAALSGYIETEGTTLFMSLLQQPFQTGMWKAEFLEYMANKLNIKSAAEPLVQCAIQEGKIYWRIKIEDKVVYDRALARQRNQFDFDHSASWLMSWEMFRKFKDAGKRTGTVVVSKERFVGTFNNMQGFNDLRGEAIWNTLHNYQILDAKDRLSKSWYPLSGHSIQIAGLGITDYRSIANTLHAITNCKELGEKLPVPVVAGLIIYRPARAEKLWQGTGRIINKGDSYPTKMWDVGVYRELASHPQSKKGELENDHIPSRRVLKEKATEIIGHLNQQGLDEQKKQTQAEVDAQGKHDRWWAIAIPEKLHRQGNTTKRTLEEQKKITGSDHPFLADINTHVSNLEPTDDALVALGAFRYMYRSMCKAPALIGGHHSIGSVPCAFFSNVADRKKIDIFFTEQIQEYLRKAEGGAVKANRK